MIRNQYNGIPHPDQEEHKNQECHQAQHNVSHVTRKSVFVVFDQVRLKPACSATEASENHEIANIETIDFILSRQRTTKALIRLRGCAGRSAPLLFAYGTNRFCHDVARVIQEDRCFPADCHQTIVNKAKKTSRTNRTAEKQLSHVLTKPAFAICEQ